MRLRSSAWDGWTRTPGPSRGGWASGTGGQPGACWGLGPEGVRGCPTLRRPAPPRCLDQMAQDGLQLPEIFTSVPLCPEEQAALLQAVRKAQPAFSPPPRPQPEPQVNTSPLLREIYAQVRGPDTHRQGRVLLGVRPHRPARVRLPGPGPSLPVSPNRPRRPHKPDLASPAPTRAPTRRLKLEGATAMLLRSHAEDRAGCRQPVPSWPRAAGGQSGQ